MHTALGAILHGFGYHLHAPHFGYGYTIRPAHHDFTTTRQEFP
ncbi:hypothetical protein ACWIGD_30480 [Streptomyces albidoflavus]|nr:MULTISPECIES: hypothetical protein [Streptomyces]